MVCYDDALSRRAQVLTSNGRYSSSKQERRGRWREREKIKEVMTRTEKEKGKREKRREEERIGNMGKGGEKMRGEQEKIKEGEERLAKHSPSHSVGSKGTNCLLTAVHESISIVPGDNNTTLCDSV